MSTLHIDGVSVRIDAARIVADVTLECPAGAFVGLIGPNGSGKSTILKTVYRALTPTSGVVRLDDVDLLRQMTARQAARRVAALAQEPGRDVDFTVAEIVAAGRIPHLPAYSRFGDRDRRVIADAVAVVGLTGHETRSFASLSGGERQRVLLARALAQEPSVLILDEPTNHLDIGTQLALLSLVRGLGVTVLAALHDLNLAAAYCDRLHLLRDGSVVAHGTPDEVLTPHLIATVFGVRAHRVPHPETGRQHLLFTSTP